MTDDDFKMDEAEEAQATEAERSTAAAQAEVDRRKLGGHAEPKRPLPDVDRDMLAAMRKLKAKRPLNDLVEDVFASLIEDKSFTRYLHAVWDSEAVEGSLAADNFYAAQRVREKAKALNSEVATYNLATIAHALVVVTRRYGFSRKERRYTVGGKFVRPDDNNSE